MYPILTVLLPFLFINKTLRLNNLKTRTAMNAKTSVFVIYIEAIIYLLLHNLHDCTFNHKAHIFPKPAGNHLPKAQNYPIINIMTAKNKQSSKKFSEKLYS